MHQVKNYIDLQNTAYYLKRISNITQLVCNKHYRLGMKSDERKNNLTFQASFTFTVF